MKIPHGVAILRVLGKYLLKLVSEKQAKFHNKPNLLKMPVFYPKKHRMILIILLTEVFAKYFFDVIRKKNDLLFERIENSDELIVVYSRLV